MDGKDYFNGLDIGLHLAGPAAPALGAFTKGDNFKLWSLLPAQARKKQIQSLHTKADASEYWRPNWITEYEDAEIMILRMQQAILALNLNPKKVFRALYPPDEADSNLFDTFADQLANPSTRKDAWIQTKPRNDFWIWSLSKYYRQCGENGSSFLICLDTYRTSQFCVSAPEQFVDMHRIFLNPKFSRIFSCILTGMTLGDISNMMAVSKSWRQGIWAGLLLNPPDHYVLPVKTSILTWLCAMRKNNFILPVDIRKMIASQAQTSHKDTIIIYSNTPLLWNSSRRAEFGLL